MTRRLTLYAHYDAHGEVKPFVRHALEALRPHSERLVFVSTGALGAEAVASLSGLCDETHLRPNEGFDFGMWQQVLARTDCAAWDEILLTNSSVFGPLWPLREAFDRMAGEPHDFWGMTDNYELKWHLQSYFLVLRRPVLASEAWARFWSNLIFYKDKWQMIMSYEVGLTSCLSDAGFSGRALVPCKSMFPEGLTGHLYRYRRRNPTCFHPVRLIEHGMPYVKVETLRDNPGHVSTARLRRVMRQHGYDLGLVAFDRPVRRRLRELVDPWALLDYKARHGSR